MTSLSKAQTERILRDIRQQGVHSPDLAEDLLDHICWSCCSEASS